MVLFLGIWVHMDNFWLKGKNQGTKPNKTRLKNIDQLLKCQILPLRVMQDSN